MEDFKLLENEYDTLNVEELDEMVGGASAYCESLWLQCITGVSSASQSIVCQTWRNQCT